ncbi:MAG: tetratricopeptide repeat protein [Vicinamibacterales bacterium]|jgi:Tfp pilus assembly protein PilF
MAKQSRQKQTRPARKKTSGRNPGNSRRLEKAPPAAAMSLVSGQPKASAPPSPPPRKPGYYEAIAIYETGVRALQRHDFEKAADQFRQIIQRYPDERELHERSVLYLRVCERETARRPASPQTPQERVYAATMALNAGDPTAALDHLQRALTDAPDSDHAHYIMAVTLASQGQPARALEHLRRSVELNPDNRALARQDPDLEDVRELEGFRDVIDAPAGSSRPRPRRPRR